MAQRRSASVSLQIRIDPDSDIELRRIEQAAKITPRELLKHLANTWSQRLRARATPAEIAKFEKGVMTKTEFKEIFERTDKPAPKTHMNGKHARPRPVAPPPQAPADGPSFMSTEELGRYMVRATDIGEPNRAGEIEERAIFRAGLGDDDDDLQ